MLLRKSSCGLDETILVRGHREVIVSEVDHVCGSFEMDLEISCVLYLDLLKLDILGKGSLHGIH